MKAKPKKPLQISKEYFRGKWQLVGFYRSKNRMITIRPVKDGAA
jgi:hypothetical protein